MEPPTQAYYFLFSGTNTFNLMFWGVSKELIFFSKLAWNSLNMLLPQKRIFEKSGALSSSSPIESEFHFLNPIHSGKKSAYARLNPSFQI